MPVMAQAFDAAREIMRNAQTLPKVVQRCVAAMFFCRHTHAETKFHTPGDGTDYMS